MKRVLIVNADDCNLTPGVTDAILDCHDNGILTSTTFMVNLPVTRETLRKVKARKKLGVGIHLNVTLGHPVSKSGIGSLVGSEGKFKKINKAAADFPSAAEIAKEYQSQILLFKKLFGRMPTHLDTHHHLHDQLFFLNVLIVIAKKNRLPMRKACLDSGPQKQPAAVTKMKTTDYFFGDLRPEGHWTKASFEKRLTHLPEGLSEVMCHPGKNDKDLKAATSFTTGRVVEWKLFRSPKYRKILNEMGVVLSSFNVL